MANESVIEAVMHVLSTSGTPMSPTQIKDAIKPRFPHLYGTERHRDGVARGNYSSLDHGLLNDIYSIVKRSSEFNLDRSGRPMLVSLATGNEDEAAPEEDYESDQGTVYVLSTGTHTPDGRKIIKIGHTTQLVSARISQLYTTGTPFAFQELRSWRVTDYIDLEQAIHRLLSPYRINRAREFFTEEALEFTEQIVAIHQATRSARAAG
jgi:hypothetical protein